MSLLAINESDRKDLMGLSIQLLGKPGIYDSNSALQPVRGHQSWALLARVLLSERPISRRQLASELFPDTDDPLGALRWCLAALRKAIGSRDALTGDPVVANLPNDTDVDVKNLEAGSLPASRANDLLEGIEPRCSAEFSIWLLVERERLATIIDNQIRQETLRAIAVSDYDNAIRHAEMGARRRPLDEPAQIYLVKSLALAGNSAAAFEHADATETLFALELGEKPSPALRAAAKQAPPVSKLNISNEAKINSLIESGLGALAGGASDLGIDKLRLASGQAQLSQNNYLHAKALFELGAALVHAVRGYDDEGLIALRQSLEVAKRCAAADIQVSCLREIGYVEAFSGYRREAENSLNSALTITKSASELSGVNGISGFNFVDWGQPERGLECFRQSIEQAKEARNYRRQIWSLGFGALGQFTVGAFDRAEQWLLESIALIDQTHWISFKPWSVALLIEMRLAAGHEPRALIPDVEETFALACELNDPCWEANATRTLAKIYAARHDYVEAGHWFTEARTRCLRETDSYAALYVRILNDQTEALLDEGKRTEAQPVARELLQAAARANMDGYIKSAVTLIEALS